MPALSRPDQDGDQQLRLLDDARDKGASVLCGGAPLSGPGFFYPPTVITGITRDSR